VRLDSRSTSQHADDGYSMNSCMSSNGIAAADAVAHVSVVAELKRCRR
jgi:hypothetical protein